MKLFVQETNDDGDTIIKMKGHEFPNYEIRDTGNSKFNLYLNTSNARWEKVSPHSTDTPDASGQSISPLTMWDADGLANYLSEAWMTDFYELI